MTCKIQLFFFISKHQNHFSNLKQNSNYLNLKIIFWLVKCLKISTQHQRRLVCQPKCLGAPSGQTSQIWESLFQSQCPEPWPSTATLASKVERNSKLRVPAGILVPMQCLLQALELESKFQFRFSVAHTQKYSSIYRFRSRRSWRGRQSSAPTRAPRLSPCQT